MTWNNEECIKHLQESPKWIYKVSRVYKKRTPSQNNYLHFIFDFIANETWDTKDRVKDTLKTMFLKSYNPIFDKEYIKDTSDLDTNEMRVFIENIRIFCLEYFWFEIPLAEDKRLYDYIN